MEPAEVEHLVAALDDGAAVSTRRLAGGYSHETCLLALADRRVVVRLGGSDPAAEAAVMAAARAQVPVPCVLLVDAGDAAAGVRPAMVLEFSTGTPLSEVLAAGRLTAVEANMLGLEVGRVAAAIGNLTLARPGFFADADLTVAFERPWSEQLTDIAAKCMAAVPDGRLDAATRRAWVDLCRAHAPALVAIDHDARLVHADLNPKNILVTRTGETWRVDAVLDWEFSYSGCPYGDAANMARFGDHYPAGYLAGFRAGFADNRPSDLPLAADWGYVGRVLDMFALSDLVTRPRGHPIAEQAAQRMCQLIETGGLRAS